MSLKLNSIDRRVLEARDAEDVKISINSDKHISRQDIVSAGRMVVAEYFGNKMNQRPGGEKFVSLMRDGLSYGELSQKFNEKRLMFAAAQSCKAYGRETPKDFDSFRKDPSYLKDSVFLNTLAAIDRDIITPLMFRVFDDMGTGGLMQWSPVEFGATKEITIRSNDVFLFQDSSWGSSHSAPYNYMYAKTITLNPKPYACNVKEIGYQYMVNGDPGDYYAAIMGGMFNKIYASFISKLTTAAENTAYIPTELTASTYSTENWNAITTKVAAVNGIRRQDLVAFGTINVLSKILPTDGSGAAVVGLQYGLGEEWFNRGFLPNASGVQLIEIQPVVVPGTQNTTIDTIDTGDNIFIAAKAGYGYAPIYGAYYDGAPIMITMTPTETADYTFDINCVAAFDVQPVFASKVGVITEA